MLVRWRLLGFRLFEGWGSHRLPSVHRVEVALVLRSPQSHPM